MSSVEKLDEKNDGPSFYSKKQVIDTNLKGEVTPARMNAVRNHMVMLKAECLQKLGQLEQAGAVISKRARVEAEFQIECQLWVLDGFLIENLSLKRLEKVAETYKKIKILP